MNTRSTLPRYIRMSSMAILVAILSASFSPAAASINLLPAIDTTVLTHDLRGKSCVKNLFS